MAELETALAGTPVRLVSVSVDPGHDTPEVLAAYARSLGADAEQWLFLTGAEEEVVGLATSIYMSAARAPEGQARPGEQVAHSTKLVVVDGQGLVRGYYEGTTEAGRRGAAERALHLASQ
jgi:protein SCO1/2